MATKKMSAHFRRVVFLGAHDVTQNLSQFITTMISEEHCGASTPQKRIRDIRDCQVVLTQTKITNKAISGTLMRCDPGSAMALIDDVQFVPKSMNAPDGYKPLKGEFHFAAIGNHLIYIERELPASWAEEYFTDFLMQLIPAGTKVMLLKKFEIASSEPEKRHVQKIILTPDPQSAAEIEGVTGVQSTTTLRREVADRSSVFDMLRAAHVDTADLGALADIDGDIQIKMEIQFKHGRKITDIEVDKVAHMLRHLPDEAYTLKGPGWSSKGSQIIAASHQTEVQMDKGLMVPEAAYAALRAAYLKFLELGYINKS